MFRNRKNSSVPKQKKTIKRQLGTTAVLVAGMVGLYILGKREDAKLQRAFNDFKGE